MTDRVKGLVITLDHDIRIDDIQPLIQAIRFMRGVANVEPSVSDELYSKAFNDLIDCRKELAKSYYESSDPETKEQLKHVLNDMNDRIKRILGV